MDIFEIFLMLLFRFGLLFAILVKPKVYNVFGEVGLFRIHFPAILRSI